MTDSFEEWYQSFVTSMGTPVKGYCRPARTEKEVVKAAYVAGLKSLKRESGELSSCDKHAQAMPHFTLIAKDNLAMSLVGLWIQRAREAGVPENKVAAAIETKQAMRTWRRENEGKCKNPD